MPVWVLIKGRSEGGELVELSGFEVAQTKDGGWALFGRTYVGLWPREIRRFDEKRDAEKELDRIARLVDRNDTKVVVV